MLCWRVGSLRRRLQDVLVELELRSALQYYPIRGPYYELMEYLIYTMKQFPTAEAFTGE